MFSPNIFGLTNNKTKTVFDGFIVKVNECKCKPNILWVDQGRENLQ